MKQRYMNFPFTKRRRAFIGILNSIVEDYAAAGFILTVRQLFYQMVSRGLIENTEKTYKQVCDTVNKAKLAGMIDWDAIEDRTRSFRGVQRWDSAGQIIRSAEKGFHMDMWETQLHRVYAIIEKEALSGVFMPVCNRYDVPLLSARGYPSGSVLRQFAVNNMVDYHGVTVFLHFGDHDPSGIDMSRDLEERLRLFGEGSAMKFHRVALNMEQILEVKPPPNPAKLTDSRAQSYIRQYGQHSYELDALDPRYLQELIGERISEYIDMEQWEKRKSLIERQRAKLSLIRRIYFRG